MVSFIPPDEAVETCNCPESHMTTKDQSDKNQKVN